MFNFQRYFEEKNKNIFLLTKIYISIHLIANKRIQSTLEWRRKVFDVYKETGDTYSAKTTATGDKKDIKTTKQSQVDNTTKL